MLGTSFSPQIGLSELFPAIRGHTKGMLKTTKKIERELVEVQHQQYLDRKEKEAEYQEKITKLAVTNPQAQYAAQLENQALSNVQRSLQNHRLTCGM